MTDANDPDRLARRELLRGAGIALVAGGGCDAIARAAPAATRTPGPFVDARDHGVVGDGVADDTAALVATLAAAKGRRLIVPPGTFRFERTLAIPDRTHVELLPGATLECRVRGAAHGITLGNGSRLSGAARSGCIIAHHTCEIASLITNAAHDGSQEYGYLEGLTIETRSGARISTALVELVSLFVNSGIRDAVIDGNDTAPIGIRIAGGTRTGFGPVYVDDVWVTRSAGHNIVITEHAPQTGSASCWLTNVTSENQGSGHHGLFIQGHGGIYNVSVRNYHHEHGGKVTEMSAAIFVDGCPGFSLDGADLLSDPIKNKRGVVITKNILNSRTRIRGIENINCIDPILDDQLHGKRFRGKNIGFYESGDCGAGNVDQMFVHLVQMPGGVSTKAKAGPISDADFPTGAPIPDGTLAVDTASSKLFVRIGGQWKSVALRSS
jgi:hypothetical protein